MAPSRPAAEALGRLMTSWAKGYDAGKASLQAELQWHRAENAEMRALLIRIRDSGDATPKQIEEIEAVISKVEGNEARERK